MKRLGILRHAKSDWGDPALDDFDRPLNERGRKAATRMGEEFRALGLGFDLALVSTARRAAETFDRLSRSWGDAPEAREEPRLYGASLHRLLAILAESDSAIERLLIVGHNPGMQELAGRLAETGRRFPAGALAEIELAISDWADIGGASGRLVRFVRPSDLDGA